MSITPFLLQKQDYQGIFENLKKSPHDEIACLVYEDTVYFAKYYRQHPFEPFSAVTILIQGIWERYPELARRILRTRIYTTLRPTEMCHGMVKVAAKRLSFGIDPIKDSLCRPLKYEEFQRLPSYLQANYTFSLADLVTAASPTSHADFLDLASQLAIHVPRKEKLYFSDRPIAALLVSKDLEILGWELNSNSDNRTLHAEIKLIQNYYSKHNTSLPPGSRIYSTLKPCKMCAGMIWTSASDILSTRIYYAHPDPGPMGKSTVLDAQSFERARASQSHETSLEEVQHHITLDSSLLHYKG
jgi:tRNA(Arg) A34 adenosine deaminase TadA